MLHCLCTATSETQFCYYETPSLQQGFGKFSVLICITSDDDTALTLNPLATQSSFGAVRLQYTLRDEVFSVRLFKHQ